MCKPYLLRRAVSRKRLRLKRAINSSSQQIRIFQRSKKLNLRQMWTAIRNKTPDATFLWSQRRRVLKGEQFLSLRIKPSSCDKFLYWKMAVQRLWMADLLSMALSMCLKSKIRKYKRSQAREEETLSQSFHKYSAMQWSISRNLTLWLTKKYSRLPMKMNKKILHLAPLQTA